MYNPLNGKVIISRIVVFDEKSSWNWSEKQIQQDISIPIKDSKDEGEEAAPNSPEKAIEPGTFATLEQHSPEPIPLRRSTRT